MIVMEASMADGEGVIHGNSLYFSQIRECDPKNFTRVGS